MTKKDCTPNLRLLYTERQISRVVELTPTAIKCTSAFRVQKPNLAVCGKALTKQNGAANLCSRRTKRSSIGMEEPAILA